MKDEDDDDTATTEALIQCARTYRDKTGNLLSRLMTTLQPEFEHLDSEHRFQALRGMHAAVAEHLGLIVNTMRTYLPPDEATAGAALMDVIKQERDEAIARGETFTADDTIN